MEGNAVTLALGMSDCCKTSFHVSQFLNFILLLLSPRKKNWIVTLEVVFFHHLFYWLEIWEIITKKCRFHNHGIDLFPWLQNLKYLFFNICHLTFLFIFIKLKDTEPWFCWMSWWSRRFCLEDTHTHTHRWEIIFTLCLMYLFVQFFCRKDLRQRNLKLWDDVNMFVGTILSWPQSV